MRANIQYIAHMPRKPARKPKRGAKTIGMRIFWMMPGKFRLMIPECAYAAPIRPPKRACDEEEGMAKYQVMQFQTIAANRAARTRI